MSMVPCYVGLDYHDDTIRVCVIDEEGAVLLNRNVANDPSWVMLTVGRVSDRVLGVAIEACCGAADVAARLQSLTGWLVKLAHAGAVACLELTRSGERFGESCPQPILPQLHVPRSSGAEPGASDHAKSAGLHDG